MKFLKNLFLITIFSIFYGCAGQEISIKTEPDQAEVYIRTLGKGESEKIGLTPIVLDKKIIEKIVGSDKNLKVLEIKRAGYLPEQILINDFGNTSVEYSFTLRTNNISDIISKIDNISTALFEAQRLLRSGSYQDSITLLKGLNKKFPFSSVITELIGSAYYLSKDMKQSLRFYDLSYKYDPKNIASYKMIQYLEKELKVKRPLLKKVRN